MKSRTTINPAQLLKMAALCFAVVLVVGCTKVNSKLGSTLGFDTDLKLTIYADKNINPDEKGLPSPLFLRLYQLTSADGIENADFVDLYENDKALLGDEFLSKQELERFAPGESRAKSFVLNPETRYVALYAEFFRYEDSRFLVVFPITESNVIQNQVYVDITSNQMLLGTKRRTK